jgi:hypothetical protein
MLQQIKEYLEHDGTDTADSVMPFHHWEIDVNPSISGKQIPVTHTDRSSA